MQRGQLTVRSRRTASPPLNSSVRQSTLRIHLRSLVALVSVASIATGTHASANSACNFSKPSSFYEENNDFVRVLNQFGGVLDLGEKELGRLVNGLTHVTGMPAQDFYYDPQIARRYEDHHTCENTGLSLISYQINSQYPSNYSFCFITEKGTIDDGEVFVEKHLYLPREKWVSHLNFPNRDGVYGTFLRTTRIGAMIRFGGVTGSYYLKHGNRYLNIFLQITARKADTAVSVMLFDSTKSVEQQIACENKK